MGTEPTEKGNNRGSLKIRCFSILGLLLLVTTCTVILALQSDDAKTSKPAESAEDRRKGFHCLSKWDGHHDGIEALIRRQLNDPGSMETYETRISPVSAGKRQIRVDFGAKNAFGGMVRRTGIGTVDHASCSATLLDIR